MGVNTLLRDNKDKVSAVWYERKNINSTTGVATGGKHIKVKVEERLNKGLSQPIRNLITDNNATLLSTRFNYSYGKFDEIYLLGKRWQVLEREVEILSDTNAIANPLLSTRTYIAVIQLGDKK